MMTDAEIEENGLEYDRHYGFDLYAEQKDNFGIELEEERT